jgi:hypothetical protein
MTEFDSGEPFDDNSQPFEEFDEHNAAQSHGEGVGDQQAADSYQAPDFYPGQDALGNEDTDKIACDLSSMHVDLNKFNDEPTEHTAAEYEAATQTIRDALGQAYNNNIDVALETSKPTLKPALDLETRYPDQIIRLGIYPNGKLIVQVHSKDGTLVSWYRYTPLSERTRIAAHVGDRTTPNQIHLKEDGSSWWPTLNMPRPGEVSEETRLEIIKEKIDAAYADKEIRPKHTPVGPEEAEQLSKILRKAQPNRCSIISLHNALYTREISPLKAEINTSLFAAHQLGKFVARRLKSKGVPTEIALVVPHVEDSIDENGYYKVETGYEQGYTRYEPDIRKGRQKPLRKQDATANADRPIPTTPYLQITHEEPPTKYIIEQLMDMPGIILPGSDYATHFTNFRFGVDPEIGTFIVLQEAGLQNPKGDQWLYHRGRIISEESELRYAVHLAHNPRAK